MRNPDPFRYPFGLHRPRHGPRGYASYRDFRPWLRDEFDFRCVYCLFRERWSQGKGAFDIDHHVPRKLREDLDLCYENLVYSCHTCNLAKSDAAVPGPRENAYGSCLSVQDDGTIVALNEVGEVLIDELELDDIRRVEFRKLMLEIVKLASNEGKADVLQHSLGLPPDLPDLARLRPPGGNARPEGVAASWRARKNRPLIFECSEAGPPASASP